MNPQDKALRREQERIRKAAYRARNPEKTAAQNAAAYAARKKLPKPQRTDDIRAKDRSRKSAYRRKYPDRAASQIARDLEIRRKDAARYLFRYAKNRAVAGGILFTITAADISVPDVCPVLGIPLAFGGTTPLGREDSPTIDRVVPDLGYVPTNIRVISYRANRIKTDATLAELRKLVSYLEGAL